MKRFDLANDVAKQLITISAAIIPLVAAFYEKFLFHHIYTLLSVLAALALFVLSLVAGVLSIGGLVLLAEEQEDKDFRAGPPPRLPTDFVSLAGTPAESWAKWQQILFGIGMAWFIVLAIVNYAHPKDPLTEQSPARTSSSTLSKIQLLEAPIAETRPGAADGLAPDLPRHSG